ncbi:MAG: flagellar motor protein [Rhodospirillales bacterium 20-64-7]|nr:MAG: flagellar motor protein [Rhodospirillales bacterium 20-64-7]
MSGIIGIVLALAMVVLGSLADGDPISALFSVTAALIVFGGTFAALLTQFGFAAMLAGLSRVTWLVKPPSVDVSAFVERCASWSNTARAQGALALEGALDEVADPFEKKGLQMIIDNTPREDLEPTLGVIGENASRDDHIAGEVWEAAGGYSPTIGVMGAVLGLIHVMMRLNHPEELGEGIATAFVATIYGVGGANLIFLPLGTRLAAMAEARERERHIMIQGFLLIAEGKPGIVIRQTLQSFMAAKKPAKEAEGAAEPMGEPAPEGA